MERLTESSIQRFREYMIENEKSTNTILKYIRDLYSFMKWMDGQIITKSHVLEYKRFLIEKYMPSSVNSVLSALNSFFEFNNWHELKAKIVKVQKKMFRDEDKELSREEYERLLSAAKNRENIRLYYLMQTICSLGIRVSELRYITVESLHRGIVNINCKGKMRTVMIPNRLCKTLTKYARKRGIFKGTVFVTKNGKPIDRSNIWSDMKKLCKQANVQKSKVFPHNLRHLFARTYYSLQKDVVRLADILGHSNINTTRIYTLESGSVHRQQIQQLGLLRC